eukprot:ctg_812.g333
MGVGVGCCLFALGWSFQDVQRRGIASPTAFSGCGVGLGFGCVGVGQGYGRYVPWGKDRRPTSLRKDLKETADDVMRVLERLFGKKQRAPLKSAAKKAKTVPPPEPLAKLPAEPEPVTKLALPAPKPSTPPPPPSQVSTDWARTDAARVHCLGRQRAAAATTSPHPIRVRRADNTPPRRGHRRNDKPQTTCATCAASATGAARRLAPARRSTRRAPVWRAASPPPGDNAGYAETGDAPAVGGRQAAAQKRPRRTAEPRHPHVGVMQVGDRRQPAHENHVRRPVRHPGGGLQHRAGLGGAEQRRAGQKVTAAAATWRPLKQIDGVGDGDRQRQLAAHQTRDAVHRAILMLLQRMPRLVLIDMSVVRVMASMGDAPAVIRHQQRRVGHMPEKVIQATGGRETAVTAIVSDHE